MNGSRAKKLRKEYRKVADTMIHGDVKMLTDGLVKKIKLYRSGMIIGFVLLALSWGIYGFIVYSKTL